MGFSFCAENTHTIMERLLKFIGGIYMLKGQYGKVLTFVKEHKLRITLSVSVAIVAMALEYARREEKRMELMTQELLDSTERLKQYTNDKIVSIPRGVTRGKDLGLELDEFKEKIEEILSKRP